MTSASPEPAISATTTAADPRSPADTSEDPPGPLARLLLGLIRLYQATAVLRAPRCRFEPTCSAYAAQSIAVHGPLRGSWQALRRIGRCHPWNPGGYDPVEPRRDPDD